MNWVFVIIAFTTNGPIVEKVLLDTPSTCVAYAQGYMQRTELQRAHIQVAQCVSLTSGAVLPLAPIKSKPYGLL